ncbi:MAG TPA: hypothetical protein VFD14_00480 [Clostridia bacterium]|nr:hypothetical protein [Clostridia bacterium]
MTKTHWREIKQTEYLGGHDLSDGKGGFKEIAVTIKRAMKKKVQDIQGDSTDELVLEFADGTKPMIMNVTNSRVLAKLLKTAYIEDWAGKEIVIGTEKVKAFGEVFDALRIRPYLPKKQAPTVNCVECGKPITPYKGAPAETIIAKSTEELGAPTYIPCWNAKREAANEANS